MARRPRDVSWPPDPEPLPSPLVDDHTHLDAVVGGTGPGGWGDAPATTPSAAGAEVREHLARATAAGVTRMVQIGCDLDALPWTLEALDAHPELLGGVAIHPNEAVLHAGVHEVAPDGLEPDPRPRHTTSLDDAMAAVAAAARHPRVRAIGETGLDFFRAGERGRTVQREAFRAHVALAKELGLALQIHDRDAHDAVLEVLEADGVPERTVFHCFSGDAAMARHCVARGWYLSFAGPVTFAANDGLRAVLRETPLTQVLLETDAPYLTPHPFRGRPNGPYLVAATARRVAEELDADLAELCRTVSRTAEQVYGPW